MAGDVCQHSRPPRVAADPDRYVRRVKGNRFQARPYDGRERWNLGIFATREQARTAVLEFWWGKRPDRPKFVRAHHGRAGVRYFALVPLPGPAGRTWLRVGGWFATPGDAGAAAAGFLTAAVGAERAAAVLSRAEPARLGPHRPGRGPRH